MAGRIQNSECSTLSIEEKHLHFGDIAILLGLIFVIDALFFLIHSASSSLWVIAFQELTLGILSVGYLTLRRFRCPQTFRWVLLPPKVLLSMIVMGIGVAILSDTLDRVVNMFFPIPEELQNWIERLTHWNTAERAAGALIGVALLAPWVEESIFRGAVQQYWERRAGALSGIFATALLFAILHFQPYWFIQLTALGVLLGLLTYRWNSILPAFIVHSTINLWTLLYPQLGEEFSQIYVWKRSIHPLFIALGTVLTGWGWSWNTRLFRQQL